MAGRGNALSRGELIALAFALIWGGVLRLGWPGLSPFAFDEARLSLMALELARNHVLPQAGLPSSAGIPNLPAQVWLFAIPYAFSTDPRIASSFVGFFSFLCLPLAWWVARRCWGPEAGLAAAWLMAGSPYLAFYSRSVWPQNWLPVMGAAWLATAAFRDRKLASFLNGFLAGFAFQVHYAGIALLIPSALLFWFIPRQSRAAWLAGFLLALSRALVYGARLFKVAGKIELKWTAGPESFLQMARLVSGMGWEVLLLGRSPGGNWKALLPATATVFLAIWGLAVLLRDSIQKPGGFHTLTLAAGLASPLLWFFRLAPPLIHYHLASLPALFLAAGSSAKLLPRRFRPLLVLLAAGISLAQGVNFAEGLNLWAARYAEGGLSAPLALQQAAVEFVKDGTPVVAFASGNRPEQDGDAAVLEVLLWGYPHRIADGLHSLIIPSEPAWLLFMGPWMPAWQEAVAHLPPESYEVYLFPRREGEMPWALLKFKGANPKGFKPVDSVRLGCGVELVGWNLERTGDGIRVETLWEVRNPERKRIHQFNHLYLEGASEPTFVRDGPTSSEVWEKGDHLITWADFPPVEGRFKIAVGMYYLPGYGKSSRLRGGDMAGGIEFVCALCGRSYPLNATQWRCSCGGYFNIRNPKPFSPERIRREDFSLWRYREMLPEVAEIVSMGEGLTPLVQAEWKGMPVYFKLEYLAPTGSFKDRGTSVLVSFLKSAGLKEVVEDSSGNAGASLAAYSARAGIRARIFVPAHASPAKKSQIAVYGAELVEIEGPREEAARAVREEAEIGHYYASHYYNPLVLEGMKTAAYEIWEQLGRAPDAIVLPVGHGTLLLGLHRGFRDLLEAGLVSSVPALYGVQARNCSPLFEAFRLGLEDVPEYTPKPTVAEGISIARPLRAKEILQAVRETGGKILAVEEEEILRARRELALRGFFVEPTSATAAAALDHLLLPGKTIVVPLTGSGLKSPV